MNLIQLYTNNIPLLHESTHALSLRGITLSEGDKKTLLDTQLYICNKRRWVETSNKKLDDILEPFLASPYMSLLNYLNILKNIIISYYEVRSRFNRYSEDNTIINGMHYIYNLRGGVLDAQYIQKVIEYVKKEKCVDE